MSSNKDIESIRNATAGTIQTINQRIGDDQVAVFDPRIKFASKKEEAEAAIVWSTKSIELAMQAIDEGQGLRVSPFLKNNPNLRKPNLLYQYTEEEIMEILKCKKDILYFAEKYVYLKTERGLQHIKLRPYQKKLLKMYQENRWNITLFPRQAGKCVTPDTTIDTSIGVMTILELYQKYIETSSIRHKLINWLWKLYIKMENLKS